VSLIECAAKNCGILATSQVRILDPRGRPSYPVWVCIDHRAELHKAGILFENSPFRASNLVSRSLIGREKFNMFTANIKEPEMAKFMKLNPNAKPDNCRIFGCRKERDSEGLCAQHYDQAVREGRLSELALPPLQIPSPAATTDAQAELAALRQRDQDQQAVIRGLQGDLDDRKRQLQEVAAALACHPDQESRLEAIRGMAEQRSRDLDGIRSLSRELEIARAELRTREVEADCYATFVRGINSALGLDIEREFALSAQDERIDAIRELFDKIESLKREKFRLEQTSREGDARLNQELETAWARIATLEGQSEDDAMEIRMLRGNLKICLSPADLERRQCLLDEATHVRAALEKEGATLILDGATLLLSPLREALAGYADRLETEALTVRFGGGQ